MNSPITPESLNISWAPAAVSDAAQLSAVFNAIAEADAIAERLSTESMEHELTSYFDPLDARTVVGRDQAGAIIAYASVYSRPAEAEEVRASVNLYVTPGWRGRGIEDALIEWAIAAARDALRKATSSSKFVCAFLYKKQEAAAARFARHGFESVRHWWEMERQLADDIAIRPEEGFEIVPWTADHDEPARLVYNAAFADHWGSTPMVEESWQKQVIASPAFRREMSFVAVGRGDVVGYSACEEYPEDWEASGQREAWVAGLGVIQEWRKRGIATALLARSMTAMRDAGSDSAMIGVDSSSPSGAQHLYQSVGFATKTMGTTWQLEVD